MLRHILQLFLDLHPTELPPTPLVFAPRGPDGPEPDRAPLVSGAPSTWARVGAPPGCAPRPPPAAPPLFRPARVERARAAPIPPEAPPRAFGTCGGRTAPLDLDARTLPLCEARPTCTRWSGRGPDACHVCTDWKG